ncbi:MAG: DNA integrity scanning protein DisA nucleotide-binding domain protein, partial [Verrucomicrobiales bacterium]|nr:DNA integrity scanning protein DisA nucleotide-binding domain protein [Verrucomicrobiales bacterium]
LLRDQLPVEECVTNVRRYLFMGGYLTREAFGLALFQRQDSWAWVKGQPVKRETVRGDIEFFKYSSLFDSKISAAFAERYERELQALTQAAAALPQIPAELLLRAFALFDSRNVLALQVLRQFSDRQIDPEIFLGVLETAKRLCHARREGHLIGTGMALASQERLAGLRERYPDAVGARVDGLSLLARKAEDVKEKVIKVDGKERAYLVTQAAEEDHGRDEVYVVDLKACTSGEPQVVGANREWSALAQLGPAIAVEPDPSGRLRVFAGGWQIAEYRGSNWCRADHQEMRRDFCHMARLTSVAEPVMLSLLSKLMLASDRHVGLSVLIEGEGSVLEHCHSKTMVSEAADAAVLQGTPLDRLSDESFLNAVAGDNSVIVSRKGMVLAYGAALAPREDTEVSLIEGTGSRHLHPQKITKETDAIAFVVSQDGPITIFVKGVPIQRYLL